MIPSFDNPSLGASSFGMRTRSMYESLCLEVEEEELCPGINLEERKERTYIANSKVKPQTSSFKLHQSRQLVQQNTI